MSLHAFWGPNQTVRTRSSSSTSSSRQSTDPHEPPTSNEKKPDVFDQQLHRSACPPHSLSFPINWAVIRRHDGAILKGIQYRIRDKRSVGRRVKVSWIYSHGAELEHSNDKYFLSADCHTKKRYISQLFAAESTTAAIQHLTEFHKVKRPSNSTDDDEDTHTDHAGEVFQLTMPFNEDEYKQKLIDWAITLRLSYREVTDETTIDLLTYGKPSLARLLPTHHSTLSQWVKDSMAARLPFIIDLVQSALSNINLSIDGWRAHNRREYAALCAHFVDGNGHPRTLLLGFPRRHGGHTGDDLAAMVKPVILQYGIGDKLGSFVMDNAGDNDKCLEALQRSFSSIDPEADRIRCIGQVINLVVKALLFGEGVSAWEKKLIEASEEGRVALWSLKGVIGKLHNLVCYFNRTDARREVLRARMRVTKTSDGKLFVGVLFSVALPSTYTKRSGSLRIKVTGTRTTFSPTLTGMSLSYSIHSCSPSSGSQSDCKAEQMARVMRAAKAQYGKFSMLWTSCLPSSRASKKRLT